MFIIIIQALGLISGFLAAIIFVLEDILPSFHAFVFRKLNLGLGKLNIFKSRSSEKGPEIASLTWKEDGFLAVYKMLRHFSPYLPPPLQKENINEEKASGVSIYIEKSLSMGSPQGVIPSPVSVMDIFQKPYRLMSKDALFEHASNYRQRILNRIGFSLLIFSLITQI